MSESERNERRRVVAMVGNPTSDKGRGAKVDAQVLGLLEEAGRAHNFDVIDITGVSFDDSLNQTRERAHEYDYLVVVGGDGRSGKRLLVEQLKPGNSGHYRRRALAVSDDRRSAKRSESTE